MEENLKMIGVKREEEIELELGLSLGGGFTRSEKPVVVAKTEPGSDLREINRTGDQKREIEASRGQEAKWKRQDTQNKKQASSCYDNGGNGVAADSNNQVRLKSTELETKEQEQRVWKKSRIIEDKSGIPALPRSKMEVGNVNSSLTVEQNVGFNSALYPVIYPYPSVQYVQFATGFQYPCLNVVPYWTAGGGAGNYHQNVVQSMVNPSLRLFQSGQEPAQNIGNGCTSDQNSTKAGSNGSPVCSSSLLSEFGSSSREGGSSCDTGSHSSHCQPKQKKLNDSKANGTKVQSEYSASSHLGETECVFDGRTCGSCCKPTTPSNNGQCSHSTNCMTNIVEPTVSSDPIDCSQQTKPKVDSATEPEQIFNPVSTTDNQSKKDMCNPPKSQNQNKPELSQMPCVSTTGNGPNGKTVNGFLYRYTKGEVSIICVCHGISFTPAEFVQHAGGTEILHPLKHITVTPSAFRR